MTVAAALKSAIMTFSSPAHPNASISREHQQCCDEPSTVLWAQHNKAAGISTLAQVSLPRIKVTPWHLCSLEKLIMAKTTFQDFFWSENPILRIFLAVEMDWGVLERVCGQRSKSLECLTTPGLEYQGTVAGGIWWRLQPELHLHQEQTKAHVSPQTWEEEGRRAFRKGWGWWDYI